MKLDGVDSSEDNGRSQGYGGLTKVGGSHMNIFVCSIVDKRTMITSSNIAYHDCQEFWRHEFLLFNGACDNSPHKFSSVSTHNEAGADQKKRFAESSWRDKWWMQGRG